MEHEPWSEGSHDLGLHGILDVGAESNLMDRHRTPVGCDFTREDTRPLIFQEVVCCVCGGKVLPQIQMSVITGHRK